VGSIAVLGGTGALGAALVQRLARAGHSLWIGSRDIVRAEARVAELTAASPGLNIRGASYRDAVAAADEVYLTVPYAAHRETIMLVADGLDGKILVDATAPLKPPKVGTVQLPSAGSAAVEAQGYAPLAKVVSALQTIGAEKLASGKAIDADVLVAADNADAANTVIGRLGEIGLRAWHVGPLANSAAAEAMTSVLIQINRRYKRDQSGLRITGKPKPVDGEAPRSPGVSITPIVGLPLFAVGDDLAARLIEGLRDSGLAPEAGDVLVVAQKIVSKVEGRAVRLSEVEVSADHRDLAARTGKPEALCALISAEAQEVMRVRESLVVVRHRLGHVLANGGIDASNVASLEEPETVLLWPADPDHSAEVLRRALEVHFGVPLAVVISDSLGRAWRMGTTGHAIGVSGMEPLLDRRGEADLFGRVLRATVVGVADELAAAASLVIGEAAEGTPAALIRGARYRPATEGGVSSLLRPVAEDLFR
jgi:coenzyme F420-0:L-glutamate ligase/NADPH-dependent F420 reductase